MAFTKKLHTAETVILYTGCSMVFKTSGFRVTSTIWWTRQVSDAARHLRSGVAIRPQMMLLGSSRVYKGVAKYFGALLRVCLYNISVGTQPASSCHLGLLIPEFLLAWLEAGSWSLYFLH